jgi:hypothetical protein
MPTDFDDARSQTPSQRLSEIASILATGYLRLKTCRAGDSKSPHRNSSLNQLEVCGPKRPDPSGLVNGSETTTEGKKCR